MRIAVDQHLRSAYADQGFAPDVRGDRSRLLLEGRPFEVWEGHQLRDFNYVDDCVAALLLAAEREEVNGQIFNLGDHSPVSLLELANLLVELHGSGSYSVHSFPAERKKIDIGDYYSDFSKYQSTTGWMPKINLREGLTRTLEYFRANFAALPIGGTAVLLPADPKASYLAHKEALDRAIQETIASGWYILGPKVALFEEHFAAYLGASSCVGVGSGTDAVQLALRACGVSPGDEVLTVSHTAVATVSAIDWIGARPVLVDISPLPTPLTPKKPKIP